MNGDPVSQHQLSAELRFIEERIERRQSEVLNRIDSISQTLTYNAERVTENIGRIKNDLDGRHNRLEVIISESDKRARDNRNLILITVIPTVVATGLTILALTYQFNASLISSFSTGLQAVQLLIGSQPRDSGPGGHPGRGAPSE